jgi:ATP-dependent protease ClpP protease subunit
MEKGKKNVKYTTLPRKNGEIFSEENPAKYHISADGSNVVTFNGDIVPEAMNELAKVTTHVAKDHRKITLYCRSEGGHAYAVGVFKEAVKMLGIKLHTVAMSIASAGVLLWMCGHTRSVVDGTFILIHGEIRYNTDGTLNEDEWAIKANRTANKRMAKIFAERSIVTKDAWVELLNKNEDAVFTAKQAKKAALAHKVIKH